MMYRKGDEKCRKHINRVVEMPKQYDHTKRHRRQDECISHQLIFPKYQCHEKGHARMSGKEEIRSKIYFTDDACIDDDIAIWVESDMSERHKNRTDGDE